MGLVLGPILTKALSDSNALLQLKARWNFSGAETEMQLVIPFVEVDPYSFPWLHWLIALNGDEE